MSHDMLSKELILDTFKTCVFTHILVPVGNEEIYLTKINRSQIVQPLLRTLELEKRVMANPNRATELKSAQVLLKSARANSKPRA